MTRISAIGKPKVGLVQFPGSNCDMDCIDALKRHFEIEPALIWHTESSLPPVDAVVLPGGFTYGDYLRAGGLAAHARVMDPIRAFVKGGGPVLGICNGFQILTETHLLPGALLKNNSQRFVCKHVCLKVEEGASVYQKSLAGRLLSIPVAHGDGRFHIDDEGLKQLNDKGQVVFRYVGEDGKPSDLVNPNGSVDAIAGVVSENGRVMGMMPHPERATDELMGGSKDGLGVWQAFFATVM